MAAFGSGSPRRFQRLAMTCFVGKTSLRGERSPTKQSSAAGAKIFAIHAAAGSDKKRSNPA
jgi:hypothetical protein